jgi:hypothetical protein
MAIVELSFTLGYLSNSSSGTGNDCFDHLVEL